MKKSAQQIRAYWDNRALIDSSAQSTTMDLWLRNIEAEFLVQSIEKYNPKSICDVGCGDGLTTLRCAEESPSRTFTGFDYSASMINNALKNLNTHGIKNTTFYTGDITEEIGAKGFDFIYSTRCLINLPDWIAQAKALMQIKKLLGSDGIYVMIENFIESHGMLNSLRADFDLPPIQVRDHNTFFERDKLMAQMTEDFNVLEDVNISSTYYMMSRVVYSAICKDKNITPDYNDIHHRLASRLPFSGEFGPVRAIVFKKKN